MRVVCIYCEKEAVPALIREKDPLDDPRVTHGICRRHQLQVGEEIEALWGHLPGRRRFGRFPVSLPVTGRSPQIGGEELRGLVRTVGAGGIMVEFPAEVPPGSTIHLVLEIRLGPLPVECRVVWARATAGTVRHGLAFLEYMGRNFATDLFIEEHR
ncbi:MAG: PilZ domain-containing protein [Candidatus Methylomirabilota bacterium]